MEISEKFFRCLANKKRLPQLWGRRKALRFHPDSASVKTKALMRLITAPPGHPLAVSRVRRLLRGGVSSPSCRRRFQPVTSALFCKNTGEKLPLLCISLCWLNGITVFSLCQAHKNLFNYFSFCFHQRHASVALDALLWCLRCLHVYCENGFGLLQ